MNKITIPALLLGVVMVAGAFAFMPVQEASTVHTSTATLQNQSVIKTITDTELTVTVGQVITIDLDAPFELLSLSVSCDTGDTASNTTECSAEEDMGIASYTRDGETTAQLLTITDLLGTDTEGDVDRVLFVFDGNTAAVTTDQTGTIAVSDRIAIIMDNDIVDSGDGTASGWTLTVTAVIRVNADVTFDATDISFS